MAARLLHHLKRPGLEHLNGLYVDVAVSNEHFFLIPNKVRDPYPTKLLKHHDRHSFTAELAGPRS